MALDMTGTLGCGGWANGPRASVVWRPAGVGLAQRGKAPQNLSYDERRLVRFLATKDRASCRASALPRPANPS